MQIEDCEVIRKHGVVRLMKMPNGELFYHAKLPWAPDREWTASFATSEGAQMAAAALVESMTSGAAHSCTMLVLKGIEL